jgi:hypothetical protein
VLRSGGGYKIEVAHPDYGTLRLVELRVQINQNTRIPVRLSRETQERVEVTASVDVVELNQTQASTRFTDEFIQGLPVANRFYQNILTLAPGVEDADGDGNPTVHGSRSRDFKAVVGGVSNVDPLTGQWMSRVNPNSIEEMEIITAGAGVEFGRAQGGYVRVIQKQGSNEFEGVFDFLWRSSELDKITDHSNVTEPTFDSYQTGFQVDCRTSGSNGRTPSTRSPAPRSSRRARRRTPTRLPGRPARATRWLSRFSPTRWRSTISASAR